MFNDVSIDQTVAAVNSVLGSDIATLQQVIGKMTADHRLANATLLAMLAKNANVTVGRS